MNPKDEKPRPDLQSSMLEQEEIEKIKNATHNHIFDKSMGMQRRKSWMDSVRHGIADMHSRDPDRFGSVTSKFDDNFGNAL
ncbi:hypothetical protein BY458DRAFT_519875 [Sporodiniella umbellata]|nr:hypothetical protein BY458DRAFT_519875 [Sporodiniella umbellata]